MVTRLARQPFAGGKLRPLCQSWLLLLLLINGTGAARAQHFTFASFGTSSGLSNLNIATMLEDHSGLIWVGTESGVFTADGTRFEKFAAFSAAGLENVRALREDNAHRIWAADGRHLVFWQNGALHSIQIHLAVMGHEVLGLEVLPRVRDTIYLLRAGELMVISSPDGGRTWSAKPVFNASLLAEHPQLSRILSLTAEGGTTLWAGCGESLCRIDPVHGTVAILGSREGVPNDSWRFMLVTREGALWARGDHRILLRVGTGDRFKQKGLQPPSSQHLRNPMLVEDPSGKIVLNTDEGIARFDGRAWQSYGRSSGLPEDGVNVLMFDRAGSLWFSSLGHGLLRWYGYGNLSLIHI